MKYDATKCLFVLLIGECGVNRAMGRDRLLRNFRNVTFPLHDLSDIQFTEKNPVYGY